MVGRSVGLLVGWLVYECADALSNLLDGVDAVAVVAEGHHIWTAIHHDDDRRGHEHPLLAATVCVRCHPIFEAFKGVVVDVHGCLA